MNDPFIEKARKGWSFVADVYVLNKSAVYPEHTLVQEFDLHHGKKILEYGSGVGSDAWEYARRNNFVTCCDIVPGNLAKAKENFEMFGLEGEFVLLDKSFPLPFEDNTFDLVNSHGVIHHIPQGPEVVKDFYRILKPGGLCYLMLYSEVLGQYFTSQIPVLMQQHNLSKEEAFCWLVDRPGTPYAIPYTKEAGEKILTDAGFKMISAVLYNDDYFRTYKAAKV